MKNWLLTIALATAVCAVSFGGFYLASRPSATGDDPMQWLRVEFKLTDAQFAEIRRLHEEYGAICAEHCTAIMAAEKRHADSTEVNALEQNCVQSMTQHFRRVAALMSPGQGKRYLETVMPRIHDYDHRGAPNVQARH